MLHSSCYITPVTAKDYIQFTLRGNHQGMPPYGIAMMRMGLYLELLPLNKLPALHHCSTDHRIDQWWLLWGESLELPQTRKPLDPQQEASLELLHHMWCQNHAIKRHRFLPCTASRCGVQHRAYRCQWVAHVCPRRCKVRRWHDCPTHQLSCTTRKQTQGEFPMVKYFSPSKASLRSRKISQDVTLQDLASDWMQILR